MARDISIAISAKDNFTDSLKKMQSMQTTFRKDLSQLNNELDRMNKNKVELKVDMTKAKNELKDAEKAFKNLGDEANRNKLIMAQAKYDTVKKNFDLVSQGAKQAERDIRNLTDTMTKSEGKGSSLGKGISETQGTLSTLAKAGLFKLVGDSSAEAINAGVSSMFGSSNGGAIASIASGAITGATIGSIIPGIGTAVGAAIGTISGTISAATQKFTEKDEAFKSVVQSNYELAKEVQDNSLSNGTSIAGKREQDRISFGTLLGNDEVANAFLKEISTFGAVTPFEYDSLTTMAKTMLAYGYKMEEVIPTLTKVGDAGSALGMSEDDINNVVTYLGRMKTTGKATLEYINPILERGVPVFDFLANALEVSNEQVQEMLSKGLIPGAEAAQIIADAMGTTYAGNMEKQSQTYEGLLSALEDAQNEIDNAMGEAYNNKRKEGLEAQINWLSSDSGTKMQEANAMIGEWKASLDNEHDAAIREAMDSMMASAEYKAAEMEGDKVKMGELLAKAQVEGENNYKATTGYQEQLASDLELIGSIRENTALKSEYYSTGYTMGQEFSKGLAAGKKIDLSTSNTGVPTYVTGGNKDSNQKVGGSYGGASTYITGGGYAYGLSSVPYDNFPALLHQGERVLTASQARQQDLKTPVQVNIAQMVVREEADINKVANILVSELAKASINFGGDN